MSVMAECFVLEGLAFVDDEDCRHIREVLSGGFDGDSAR
jgi:hypothetical protein